MAGEDTLVAGMTGRYATALFELARETGELASTETALGQFEALLDESAELRAFVRSPLLSAQDQSRVITAIASKANMGALTANFLQLLVKNRRLFAVRDVIASFRKLAADSRDEITARVVSAIPLSDKLTEELRATLKAKTGKDVSLAASVDPAILGGLVVKIGSRMIDTSIRTKLNNLKTVMKEVG